MSSHLSRSFGWLELCLAWGAYIEATTERRHSILTKALHRITNRLLSLVFSSWVEHVSENDQRRQIVLAKMSLMGAAFRGWRADIDHLRRTRMLDWLLGPQMEIFTEPIQVSSQQRGIAFMCELLQSKGRVLIAAFQ